MRAFRVFGGETREAEVTSAGHLVYNGTLLNSGDIALSSVFHKYHWRILNDQKQLELDQIQADIRSLKARIEQLNRSACELVGQGQRLAEGD